MGDLSGPEPGAVASEWVALLRAGDFAAAWQLTTDAFRLANAQAWITGHRGIVGMWPGKPKPDELARALSQERAEHELWPYLVREVERQVRGVVLGVLGERPIGTSTRPRPIAPDIDLVHVIPLDQLTAFANGVAMWQPGQVVDSVSILLQRAPNGWRVAGVADHLPVPGWLPSFERVADLGD